MRTTVNIDDQLLARAQERARSHGRTVGSLIEEALQALLTAPSEPLPAPELPTVAGGQMPGIDYSSNASLFAALDDNEELRRQAGLSR